MKVELIAKTEFITPPDVPWTTDADGGEALVELAGRSCYQSWEKPNPVTATNAGYIKHLLSVGHLSVLEHGSATFYITGVSRSLTHELVRHRHFSFSQLSQRFVNEKDAQMIEPPVIANNPAAHKTFEDAVKGSQKAYDTIVAELDSQAPDDLPKTLRRKRARQAARAVLPNATETKIVVTGNYRAWRHFISLRATEHADPEIRVLAVVCLAKLMNVAPNIFGDFEVFYLSDGTQVASSKLETS
jgi:thymidylate synthase (FAD)